DCHKGKKAWPRGLSWPPSGPLTPSDALDAGRVDARRPVRSPSRAASHLLRAHTRMVKKLEPGLTGEVTIQPSLAPRLAFNCAMSHIHHQCARKRWRGTDAWIGRPCWRISQGPSIKNS